MCGTTKASRRDVKTVLRPELAYENSVLCEKINEAFVSAMQDYLCLSGSVCVAREDDTVINVTECIVSKLTARSKSRAGGPDDLPFWVLGEYTDVLAFQITDSSEQLLP